MLCNYESCSLCACETSELGGAGLDAQMPLFFGWRRSQPPELYTRSRAQETQGAERYEDAQS